MNELDLTTKIEGLKKAIAEHKDFAGNYESDLAKCEQQLKDINKPELTPMQLDNIHEAIENVVNDFNFEDTGNYNIEYELDYDGRVNASSLEFQSSYELVEMIVDKVHNLFKEADCPTDKDENNETNK